MRIMLFLRYFDLIDWQDEYANIVHSSIDNDRLIYILAMAFSLSKLRLEEPDAFKSTLMDVIGYSDIHTNNHGVVANTIFDYIVDKMKKLIYITNVFNDCNVEEHLISIKRIDDGVYITYHQNRPKIGK